MARYFFEVRGDKSVFENKEGEEYSGDAVALERGRRLAAQFAEDVPELNGDSVTVLNQEGERLGEFAIRAVDETAPLDDDAAREELERRIRDRAYRIWLDEGQPEGKYLDHWFRAQREIQEEEAVIKGTEDLTIR